MNKRKKYGILFILIAFSVLYLASYYIEVSPDTRYKLPTVLSLFCIFFGFILGGIIYLAE